MFTGIISDIGEVVARDDGDEITSFMIASRYDPRSIDLGASIACDGVCLTVVSVEPEGLGAAFAVEAGPETQRLTTVGEWGVGRRLNLERALKIGDELGGHLVLGHVDGAAEIVERDDGPDTSRFVLAAPLEFAKFIAVKGSVCLDGISLTVNQVDRELFSVHLIPHTLGATTWADRQVGDRVNLEVDMMARYAGRLAEARSLGY